YGACRYGVTLMSSNEYRSVNDLLPQFQSSNGDGEIPGKTATRIGLIAATNAGHYTVAGLPSGGRGGHGERSGPAGRAGAGRAGAPPGRGGDRAAVQLRRVLPGCGQGAGQVRDAAGAPGRGRAGHGGRGGARVLPGG